MFSHILLAAVFETVEQFSQAFVYDISVHNFHPLQDLAKNDLNSQLVPIGMVGSFAAYMLAIQPAGNHGGNKEL